MREQFIQETLKVTMANGYLINARSRNCQRQLSEIKFSRTVKKWKLHRSTFYFEFDDTSTITPDPGFTDPEICEIPCEQPSSGTIFEIVSGSWQCPPTASRGGRERNLKGREERIGDTCTSFIELLHSESPTNPDFRFGTKG